MSETSRAGRIEESGHMDVHIGIFNIIGMGNDARGQITLLHILLP
jgi:hypothetical protein